MSPIGSEAGCLLLENADPLFMSGYPAFDALQAALRGLVFDRQKLELRENAVELLEHVGA